MQGLYGNECAGGTDGVTQRDTRSIGVYFGRVQAQVLRYRTGLRGECLVGFYDIEIRDR